MPASEPDQAESGDRGAAAAERRHQHLAFEADIDDAARSEKSPPMATG